VSSSSRRGLPDFRKMRHDRHFVEALENHALVTVGHMIRLDLIEANREQPRTSLGDLSELIASVRAKGILEPLLVRRIAETDRYQLIAGERRLHAAREAGLVEVPCIELAVSDQEAIELALIENLQRKDLSPFEEADGYRTLVEKYEYTHDQVAQAVGKSRPTITETLRLLDIPPALRDLCRHADITAKSILLLIARADSIEEMERLVQDVVEKNVDRDTLRAIAKSSDSERQGQEATAVDDADASCAGLQRFRPVHIRFRPENDEGVHFAFSIRRPGVSRDQVIATLEALLERLRAGELDERLQAVAAPVQP
jgi:ParB family chromosome partitioning protein